MTAQNTIEKLKWYVDQYVDLGLKVLPVWGIISDNGKHICACPKGEHCDQKPGKHPLTHGLFKSGVHSATLDKEALHEVIDAYPEMNVAIAVPDGMIVIDVDPRNGGDYQLSDIEGKNGKFPDTWDQITGGGGRHLCYQVSKGMKFAGKLAPGIDIKQAGGYIMVEPSMHESGHEYSWEASSSLLEGISIEMAPSWLVNIAERPNITSVSEAMATYSVDEIVISDLRSALLSIDPDDRDTWIRIGHSLKTIGNVGLDIWDQWSQRSTKYKASEIVYRWNGFAPGNITYKTVFHIAQDNGWTNAAKVRPKSKPMQHSYVDEDTGEITQYEKPERPLFTQVDELLNNLKPVQWLIENYLETDALSMVFGPSGGGKSFTVVDMACCVATGTAWHGMPVKQGAVFYIAGEGHNGLARRFAAWQKARGVKLDKNVPLFKSNRAVMLLNVDAASGLADEVDRLVRETGHQPSMVIVDTLARNFGDGDENKQQDASMFIEHLDEYIRRRWQCNVMTVHHSGHDMDRARGSSALKGAMDQEIWVKGSLGLIDLQVTKMKDAEIPSNRRFRIAQTGLGVMDECEVEITGAYLEVDGNPLEFKIGSRKNGTDLTALDVAKAMYPKWPGLPPMSITLGCGERSVSRMMKTMRQQGLAEGGKGGWNLSEMAINYLSMTGFLAMQNGET